MCGAECGGGEGARRPSGAQGRPDHCVSSSITRADAKGGRWRTCGHLGAPAQHQEQVTLDRATPTQPIGADIHTYRPIAADIHRTPRST